MGCSNSKVDNEDAVARCKQRKRLIKQTVLSRHNFAASNAQFLSSLKGVGSAFRQFAEGEEIKDAGADTMCPLETPTTSRTPVLSLGPPPLLPAWSLSYGFSSGFSAPFPHSPLQKNPSATRSPNSTAASSPESFSIEFLPPPPPIIANVNRMEHIPLSIQTKIYKFEGYLSSCIPGSYKLEDFPPPPLIQPIQLDDDWRYSCQTPSLSNAARENNSPPPVPSRISWQDLFLDPFQSLSSTFSSTEHRRNHESEASQCQEMGERSRQKFQRGQIPEVDHSRKDEIEQKKFVEEQRKALEVKDMKVLGPELRGLRGIERRRAEDSNGVKDVQNIKNSKPELETLPKSLSKVQDQVSITTKSTKAVKAHVSREPPKLKQRENTLVNTEIDLAVIKMESGDRDLLDVLKEVDDHFLKAAERGEDVSRILETKKTHYHTSFSDSLKVVGESARMNFLKLSGKSGLSGGKHSRTSSNTSVLSDDSANIMSIRSISDMRSARWSEECGLRGSHSETLDKLFAWEKKLFSEVKEADALRINLERKYYLFKNQDARNEDQINIVKTRASIRALQTRMVVAIQAVDGAAQQVQKLRDEELYPQVLELLEGMGTMWRGISLCHQAQLKAVKAMKRLDNSAACKSTTSFHRHSTAQLELALNSFVESQRDYMKNLTSWLRLSLMKYGTEEDKSGSRSPVRSPRSPLCNVAAYGLCLGWEDALDQLADRVVLEGVGSFSAVVREMMKLQWEELRLKRRVETYHRELEKRENALLSATMRDTSSIPPPVPQTPSATSGSDMDSDGSDVQSSRFFPDRRFDIVPGECFPERTEVAEKRLKMESTKRKLENELEAEKKAYTCTRAYTLNSLQAGLPQLFQAVIAFSDLEAEIHDRLSSTQQTLH